MSKIATRWECSQKMPEKNMMAYMDNCVLPVLQSLVTLIGQGEGADNPQGESR